MSKKKPKGHKRGCKCAICGRGKHAAKKSNPKPKKKSGGGKKKHHAKRHNPAPPATNAAPKKYKRRKRNPGEGQAMAVLKVTAGAGGGSLTAGVADYVMKGTETMAPAGRRAAVLAGATVVEAVAAVALDSPVLAGAAAGTLGVTISVALNWLGTLGVGTKAPAGTTTTTKSMTEGGGGTSQMSANQVVSFARDAVRKQMNPPAGNVTAAQLNRATSQRLNGLVVEQRTTSGLVMDRQGLAGLVATPRR